MAGGRGTTSRPLVEPVFYPPTERFLTTGSLAVGLGSVAAGALADARPAIMSASALVTPHAAPVRTIPRSRLEVSSLLVAATVFILYVDAPVVAHNVHGVPYVAATAVLGLLLIPIVAALRAGEPVRLGRPFGWMVGLLLIACVSAAASERADRAIADVGTYAVEGILVYLLVVNAVRAREALRYALWAVVAAGTFLALLTVLQQITGRLDTPFGGFAALDVAYFLGKASSPRAYGPVADPNYYAQLLLPPLAIALSLALSQRRGPRRLAFGVAAGLMLVAIGYTQSRGATLGLIALAAGLLATRTLRRSQLAVLAAGLAILVTVMPAYRERIASLATIGGATAEAGSDTAADDSTRMRLTENLAAMLAVEEHPVTGVGPGVFPQLYQEYGQRVGLEVHEKTRRGAEAGQAPSREAHNLFLGVAADMGVPGLVLFCGLLLSAVAGVFRARVALLAADRELARAVAGLFAGVLAYLAAGLFLSLAFERYLWLLVGLAGAATIIGLRTRAAQRTGDGLRAT